MKDEMLCEKLMSIKGIGPWSVHMFMIFTLHRPDVLPVGDLAVRRGVEKLYGLKGLPSPEKMESLCRNGSLIGLLGLGICKGLLKLKGFCQILLLLLLHRLGFSDFGGGKIIVTLAHFRVFCE